MIFTILLGVVGALLVWPWGLALGIVGFGIDLIFWPSDYPTDTRELSRGR